MSKVMASGVGGSYKGVFMKTLLIGDENVVVSYNKLSDGTIRIKNG